MATIDIMAAIAVVSGGNIGVILENPALGWIPTRSSRINMAAIITIQKTNCMLPDKVVPLILKNPNTARTTAATKTSVK